MSRSFRMEPRPWGYSLLSWEHGRWETVGGSRTLGWLFVTVYLYQPSITDKDWDLDLDRPPDTALKIAALDVVEEAHGFKAGILGETYTDAAGNIYTRTDRGWVLSEYGAGGPPSGALAAGRTPAKKLN